MIALTQKNRGKVLPRVAVSRKKKRGKEEEETDKKGDECKDGGGGGLARHEPLFTSKCFKKVHSPPPSSLFWAIQNRLLCTTYYY